MDKNIKDRDLEDKIIHIPDELMQFVQKETYSLLIKGYAGTGKTTLSLTILKALDVKNNFFYISTRISPNQLFQYYPWLRFFVDDSKDGESQVSSDRIFDMPSFEDARLDEPESLFERITNQLMDVKAPIIIIDSWDAIASFMDKEARINNERVLQTWRERAGAKLIFISEDPKDTTLDFLVDGIVELEQKYYENTRIREIYLSKLRGVRINKPSYIYTLNNAVFRSYDQYHPARFMILPNQKKQEAKSKMHFLQSSEHISTGYEGLDLALGGGFPKKGIVLIEMGSHIGTRVLMAFLARIMSNFVTQNNPLLFKPFEGIDPKMIITYIQSQLLTTQKKGLVKILWPTGNFEGMQNYIVPFRYSELDAQFPFFQEALVRLKQDNPDKILLNIVGDNLFDLHGNDEIKKIEAMSFLRSNADLSIIVAAKSFSIHHLIEVPDIHLKFIIINGTLFLQSISPWTHLYAVVTNQSSGFPEIRLEPLV